MKSLRVRCDIDERNCGLYQILFEENFDLHNPKSRIYLWIFFNTVTQCQTFKTPAKFDKFGHVSIVRSTVTPLYYNIINDDVIVEKLSNITEFGIQGRVTQGGVRTPLPRAGLMGRVTAKTKRFLWKINRN